MIQEWFTDAKLGIFIHWGIYSKGEAGESWPIYNGQMPYEDYMAQAASFTASRYDPNEWADLFSRAGARYAVLTAKHHDGFALWDTRYNRLNAKEGSPAGRDLIDPFCNALRKKGLKVGLYFSHLDWSHPGYATILPTRPQADFLAKRKNRYAFPQGAEDPEAWNHFLDFHRGQLKELCARYSPDLLWFDGDWDRDPEQWRFKELRRQLKRWAPGVILNGRMGGYGDYQTPEQSIPVTQPEGPWEFNVTLNDSWGYQKKDHNYKTVRQCVQMLASCAGMGGNLLLDVGPMSNGAIPSRQIKILEGLGRWMRKHGEAIYGTVAGLPHGHFYGPSTLNKTRDILYLFYFDRPMGPIAVKGLKNEIRRASIIGGGDIHHRKIGGAPWVDLPGILWIDVPDKHVDPDATVIKLELDGPLRANSGSGQSVSLNL
ncbi:MAG TPA: alpha-L-fucosidase [Chthoniobacteraceae bacterium]|jgi:alpha-L-fucosidase|nr:alpha-L-fucosidase [Chthoniobacteraceae bacterium]